MSIYVRTDTCPKLHFFYINSHIAREPNVFIGVPTLSVRNLCNSYTCQVGARVLKSYLYWTHPLPFRTYSLGYFLYIILSTRKNRLFVKVKQIKEKSGLSWMATTRILVPLRSSLKTWLRRLSRTLFTSTPVFKVFTCTFRRPRNT